MGIRCLTSHESSPATFLEESLSRMAFAAATNLRTNEKFANTTRIGSEGKWSAVAVWVTDDLPRNGRANLRNMTTNHSTTDVSYAPNIWKKCDRLTKTAILKPDKSLVLADSGPIWNLQTHQVAGGEKYISRLWFKTSKKNTQKTSGYSSIWKEAGNMILES